MNKIIPISIASVLLALGVFTYLHIPKVEATFNGYIYQRTLTVTNASSTQSNFPVLVCFNVTQGNGNTCTTATDLKASSSSGSILTLNASSTPNDLIFSTSSLATTILPFEIEGYSSTTGELEAWVNMPTVANGQVLYMYYGKSGDSNHQNVNGTWASGYKSVQHLPNGSVLNLSDSTSNGNNGTNNGATASTGQIDGASNFVAGSSQYIATGVTNFPTGNSPVTMEAWVNSTGATSFQVINYYGSDGTMNSVYLSDGENTNNTFSFSWFGGQFSQKSALPINTWHHVVGTWDGTTGTIYVDGVAATGSSPGSLSLINSYDNIGRYSGGLYFDGKIDEIRMSNVAYSSNWILTEYNNQSNNATFWTVSAANTGVVIVAPVANVSIFQNGKIDIKQGGSLKITSNN